MLHLSFLNSPQYSPQKCNLHHRHNFCSQFSSQSLQPTLGIYVGEPFIFLSPFAKRRSAVGVGIIFRRKIRGFAEPGALFQPPTHRRACIYNSRAREENRCARSHLSASPFNLSDFPPPQNTPTSAVAAQQRKMPAWSADQIFIFVCVRRIQAVRRFFLSGGEFVSHKQKFAKRASPETALTQLSHSAAVVVHHA